MVAVVVFGVLWLVFMQMTPRMVLDAPAALTPTTSPTTPPFDVPAAAVPEIPPEAAIPAPQPAESTDATPAADAPADSEPVALSEEKTAPEPASPEHPPENSEALKTLSAKLDALTATLQHASGEGESLRALRLKVEALEAEQKRTLMLLAAMHAFDRLKERILQGKPFTPELERLQRTVESDATLLAVTLPLAEVSDAGLPTAESLRRDFASASAPLRNPPPAADAGWLAAVLHNMQQLIRIRKVGDVKGDDVEAILARAEAALEADDVEKAAREITALGSPNEALRTWLINTKRYLERDRVLQDIKTALLSAHAPATEP